MEKNQAKKEYQFRVCHDEEVVHLDEVVARRGEEELIERPFMGLPR